MPNYQNGRIYVIRSFKTDNIYIGSTTQKLCKRMDCHRAKYKRWTNKLDCYYASFDIIKYRDSYIELYEKYPCNSKEELCKREGELIRNTEKCINKAIAGRTSKEYREDNKEKLNKNSIEWHKNDYNNNPQKYKDKNKYQYEKNKEDRKEYQREYTRKNKQEIKIKAKEYREKHKETIAKRKKEKIICNCGGTWTKGHGFKRHEKTIKHQNYIQSIE